MGCSDLWHVVVKRSTPASPPPPSHILYSRSTAEKERSRFPFVRTKCSCNHHSTMLLFLKLNRNSPHGELPQLQLALWQASLVNADVMSQQGECVHSRQHVKTTAAVHVLRKTHGWVLWHGPSLTRGRHCQQHPSGLSRCN